METKNLKFLGVINGIYNKIDDPEAADFNIFSNLLVYATESENIKIKYKEIIYTSNCGQPLASVNEGEFWLNDGELALELIIANFNERVIKELIFAKFNDYRDRHYNFMEVY